ncbi:DUF418 domain-containing protein [Paraliomyxa miuraensis]|uniref:DUF418 domain-containing protein n=1 Tax=Paraliomyxa miuraensis TaxID=376150 RepID=UPI002256BD94|nr:heparan-alpha-glucosaminide N-acetyltransferase domain-containing protein [Paraliomyxa miuraensis]MCX4242009.1 heparan-alpha-glucosaminide N-acetyltransferase domain-containing protein [Paraliomyxa miuraensis]
MSNAIDMPSGRLPGYDVARAIAVLGMIMVDVRHEMLAYHGSSLLRWLFDGIEGKAAALFVLLAGAGLSLRSHQRDEDYEPTIDYRPLVERALLLIALGLLLLHLWEYDILHFHGVYLLLAIPLLRAPSRALWLLAVAAVWIAMVLAGELDWAVRPTLTPGGVVRHVFFNGLYPVFPWIAFLLVGMAIGRLELGERRVRRRALAIAVAVALLAFGLDTLGRHERQHQLLGLGGYADWLLTWPRAPRPFFIVSGSAIAVATICGCIELSQRRGHSRRVLALVATGQLAFTIYFLHVVAILVPLEHGFLRGEPLELAFAYAVACYGAALAFALWWRHRWRHGPLEGLLRQVTARERSVTTSHGRLREQ